MLREDLLLTTLDAVEHNHRYGNFDLQLSEYGKTYHKNGENSFFEPEWITLTHTGKAQPAHWAGKTPNATFYTIGKALEQLDRLFGLNTERRELTKDDRFAYGLELYRGEKTIARYGRIANQQIGDREIKGDVFFAEITWLAVLRHYRKVNVQYKPLPKFPAITRDISMIVPDTVSYAEIRKAIHSCNPKLIRDIAITDVYKGDSIGAGKKSYLIQVTLLDEKKTLTVKAADKTMDRVFKKLEGDFGVEIRK